MRETIRTLFQLFSPRQRRRWLALVPLLCLTGVVETVGAGLVFLLIRIAGTPEYALEQPLLARAAALLPARPDARTVALAYGGCVAVYFLLRSLFLLAVKRLESRAVSDGIAELTVRTFRSYLAAPLSAHLRHKPSDLAYDVTSNVNLAVEHGMGALVQILSEVLVSAGLVLFLLVLAPVATLVTAAALLLLAGPRCGSPSGAAGGSARSATRSAGARRRRCWRAWAGSARSWCWGGSRSSWTPSPG
jgi:hypothetical protein